MIQLLILLVMFSTCLPTEGYDAAAVCLMDYQTGRVLYGSNIHQKMGMASTTKIMTALVALDMGQPDDIVTVTEGSYGTEGSSMYLQLGEQIKLIDVLYGLMLSSGNDAANAIALHFSNTLDDFAAIMTKKAKELGALNTRFQNPSGLSDDQHYSTAYDMALITRYAMSIPEFAEIVGTKSRQVPFPGRDYPRWLTNHNKLLDMYEGCDGVKTGFTKSTGRCLVSSAMRDGHRLVAVTLRAPDDWNIHKSLFDDAFSKYKEHVLCESNEHITEIPMPETQTLGVATKERKSVFLEEHEKTLLDYQQVIDQPLATPISQGQTVGSIIYYLDDNEIARTDLVAENDIAKTANQTATLWDILMKMYIEWI